MKLYELLSNLTKEEWNHVPFSQMWCGVLDEMQIYDYNYPYNIDDLGIDTYWMGRWYDTDTHVGYAAMFWNGELLCVTSQHGRKTGITFEWVSESKYKEFKNYLISVFQCEEKEGIMLLDFDEDIGEGFNINFDGESFEEHFTKPCYTSSGNVQLSPITYPKDVPSWRRKEVNTSQGIMPWSDITIPWYTGNYSE